MFENCLAIKFLLDLPCLNLVNFLTLFGCQLLFLAVGTNLIKVIRTQCGETP